MADGPRGGVMLFLALFSIFIGQIQSQGGIGRSPVDLVFVYDTSQLTNTTESLDEETMVKQFFSTFLESADVASGAVKVAFLTYSTHPEIVFNLDDLSTKEDMNDAIFGADFTSGERNTADALALVRSKVLVRDRKNVPNVVLLVQTGKSNRNEYRSVQEAEALKYARANIFVVGYGLDTSAEEEVNEIASKPIRENTFLMGSVYELDIVKEIVFAQIFTRAEQAFNSPAAGSESLDLVFLVHFSQTMKKEEHQRILEFMKAIVQYASIDDDKLRVGAVVYRKKAVPLFDFNAYTTKDQVMAGIDQISYYYRSKAASVASGFETVGSSLLVDSAGYRRDVPNLVVLITDANADTDIIDTIPAAEKLKASGTTIFTVGINVTNNDELSAIASSQAYTLFVDDSSNLQGKDYLLQDQFVGLRTEDLPLIIPAFESTTTTTVTPSTSTACGSGLDRNGTAGETVDGELLVKMGRQIKQPLLTLIGMAIRNLHQCAEWTMWTTCTSNGRPGNFGTRNRSRTCIKSTPTENTNFADVEHDIRLCEGFCPSSYNWTENGYCVKLNSVKMDCVQAERICQEDGGHLALIDSDSKFNDLKKMFEGITEFIWIDGRRKDNTSPWENVHGIKLNKFFWHSSQPDNGSNELYVVLRNDNTREWHDATCGSTFVSLCEITE